jgi:hypothetical protein
MSSGGYVSMSSNGMIRTVFAIGVLVMANPVNGYAKGSPEELAIYAARFGGQWDESSSSIRGRNAAIVTRLKSLSPDARARIVTMQVTGGDLRRIPDLSILPSLKYLDLSYAHVSDIRGISGTPIVRLLLSDNPIDDIGVLSECTELEDVTLVNTEVTSIPDLSRLSRLRALWLGATPIRSLKNVETIPGEFDLDVMRCDQPIDIEALKTAKVRTLYIDSKNYERLKPWFSAHEGELRTRNPKFGVEFQIIQ